MDCQIHAYNARMSIISKIFGPGSAKGKEAEDNPALTFIKSAPQDRVTEALVTAFPAICGALLDGAKKNAERIGLTDALFVQCIIDLELLGGFDIVVGFTGDNRLASAYIDAIVFDLTGKNPSIIPSETELWSGGTEKYRGVAKYIMAKDSFQLPRPEAHLFGKEYSQIRTGSPADLAEIAAGSSAAALIFQTGKSVFHHFLAEPIPPVPHEEEKAITVEELMAAVEAKRREKAARPGGV